MKTSSKARFGTVGAGLAAILLASMAFATLPVVFASNTSYNSIQVFVTTSSNLNYTYFFTAYNLTGALIGTTQTPYPAAGFELPAGTYLFTVSAIEQTSYGCYVCAQPLTSGAAIGRHVQPSNSQSNCYQEWYFAPCLQSAGVGVRLQSRAGLRPRHDQHRNPEHDEVPHYSCDRQGLIR